MIKNAIKSPKMARFLRIGWVELVAALMLGTSVRLRNGRTITLYMARKRLPGAMFLDPTLQGFDFSKWQGNINFATVAQYAKFIILRVSYGNKIDERFLSYIGPALQYFPGKLSVYHYYDPIYSPQQQANALLGAISPYKGKIKRVWIDLEFSWSGSYSASSYWKQFAELIIAAGYKIGFYTRATWWDSRVGTLVSWFAQFPLWAAQYAASLTLIPKGWGAAQLWQRGTPAIGHVIGVESAEVDDDIADDQFYQSEYGDTNGGNPMKETHTGWVLVDLNIRSGPSTDYPQSLPPRGILHKNDIVLGQWDELNTKWFHFDRIIRADNTEEIWDAWASAVPDSAGNPLYIRVEVNADPPPAGKSITVTVEVEGYKPKTFTDVLEPL